MATPTAAEAATTGKGRLGRRRSRRADDGFRYLTLAAGLLVLAILALIAWSTTKRRCRRQKTNGLLIAADEPTWTAVRDNLLDSTQ